MKQKNSREEQETHVPLKKKRKKKSDKYWGPRRYPWAGAVMAVRTNWGLQVALSSAKIKPIFQGN